MADVAARLLAELGPMIPGIWGRHQKLQFEIAFRTKITEALSEAYQRGRRQAEQAAIEEVRAFEGWRLEIDRAAAMKGLGADSQQPVVYELGRAFRTIANRMQERANG